MKETTKAITTAISKTLEEMGIDKKKFFEKMLKHFKEITENEFLEA